MVVCRTEIDMGNYTTVGQLLSSGTPSHAICCWNLIGQQSCDFTEKFDWSAVMRPQWEIWLVNSWPHWDQVKRFNWEIWLVKKSCDTTEKSDWSKSHVTPLRNLIGQKSCDTTEKFDWSKVMWHPLVSLRYYTHMPPSPQLYCPRVCLSASLPPTVIVLQWQNMW